MSGSVTSTTQIPAAASGDYSSVIINTGLESTGPSISKKMMIAAGCVLGFSAAAYLGKDLILNYFLPAEIPMPTATTIIPSIPASPLPEPASLESMVGSVAAFLGLAGLSIYQFNSQPKAVDNGSIPHKKPNSEPDNTELPAGKFGPVSRVQGQNPEMVRAKLPYTRSSFKPWEDQGVQIGNGIILNPKPGQLTSSLRLTGTFNFVKEDDQNDGFEVVRSTRRKEKSSNSAAGTEEEYECFDFSSLPSSYKTGESKSLSSENESSGRGRLLSNHTVTTRQTLPSSQLRGGFSYADALRVNLPQAEENTASEVAYHEAEDQTDYSNLDQVDLYQQSYDDYYGLGNRGYFSDSDVPYLEEQYYHESGNQEPFSG